MFIPVQDWTGRQIFEAASRHELAACNANEELVLFKSRPHMDSLCNARLTMITNTPAQASFWDNVQEHTDANEG